MEQEHTTYSGNQTHLDLTFVSSYLSNISNWNVQNDTLGSDHFLIKIELYQIKKFNKDTTKTNSWNYKKAKWNLFRENLETLQGNISIDDDITINNYWEIISKDITEAANNFNQRLKKVLKTLSHIGMKNVRKPSKKEKEPNQKC